MGCKSIPYRLINGYFIFDTTLVFIKQAIVHFRFAIGDDGMWRILCLGSIGEAQAAQ